MQPKERRRRTWSAHLRAVALRYNGAFAALDCRGEAATGNRPFAGRNLVAAYFRRTWARRSELLSLLGTCECRLGDVAPSGKGNESPSVLPPLYESARRLKRLEDQGRQPAGKAWLVWGK